MVRIATSYYVELCISSALVLFIPCSNVKLDHDGVLDLFSVYFTQQNDLRILRL